MSTELASSPMPRPRLSDVHKSRVEVFVEIPPSPAHIARLTPKNTPNTTAKSTLMKSQGDKSSQVISNSNKRKLDVFVEIPPSPLHRTTLSNLSGPTSANPLLRRRSHVYVEIPPSPFSMSRTKGTLDLGIKASPLSTKAFNFNTHTESPHKKRKISDIAKQRAKEPEGYPNGYFYCHQCRRKFDNSYGLHCTILSSIRCKSKYCKPCLRNRYGRDIEAIKLPAAAQSEKHVPGVGYQWICPKCEDNCNCTPCRKSKGLPPTGKLLVRPQVAMANSSTHTGMTNVFKLNGLSTAGAPNKDVKDAQLIQAKPRAPRAKKPVREPKWTAVSMEFDRPQVEDRFFLREFMLRFSPLMPRIGVTHLEELDLFHMLSRQCAKVLVHSLLDLIAADAELEEQKMIRDTLKKLSGSGTNPASLWARLDSLCGALPNDFFVLPIPKPAARPSFAEDESEDDNEPTKRTSSRIKSRQNAKNSPEEEEVLNLDNGVTHALQLLPCIIALCECALHGPSVRAEIEEGTADARGENRSYAADVRKENELWAEKRASLGWGEGKEDNDQVNEKASEEDATKKGKAKAKDTEKDKIYRAARAGHKLKLTALEKAHMLELQSATPRFGPLGRDSQGCVYYASSMRWEKEKRKKSKTPDEEDRTGLRKWGWFLAVWGRGGIAGIGEDEKERWWGFADPAEVRQLAKWVAAVEGVDGKDSVVEGPGGAPVKGIEELKKVENTTGGSVMHDKLGPPSRVHVKALVKGLHDYADILEWRLTGGEA